MIELGGGTRARGEGFANIDIVQQADFEWDLNKAPYPFPDDSVDEVYSSHCLEHLDCPPRTLREIVRICRMGAQVEIRVPHPASQMAMCAGHKHVFSPLMVDNIMTHFPELHWTGPKRLRLKSLRYNATGWLEQAKQELPFLAGLDDQIIMKWIPNACHESVFLFEVTANG
jgi:ubiquinone/menaquinone biosynthesis C-methylase UbiE